MSQVPTEMSPPVAPVLSEAEVVDPRFRQFDVFTEVTTQMLATTTLHERLLLALEAIVTGMGYPQAAVAMINEREAALHVRAAVGFDDDEDVLVEMPLDSSAACVRVVHEGCPIWISSKDVEQSRA